MSSPLLVTVRLDGGQTVDLAISAGPDTRVGTIAERISAAAGISAPARSTIAVPDAGPLPPEQTLGVAPIRSGEVVEIVDADGAERSREPPHAIVEVLAGPLAGARVPLPDGQFTIGRSSKSDIALRDDTISAAHVRLTVADRFIVEDLGSTNGTSINDGPQIAEPHPIGEMDSVTIGSTVFRVRRPRSAAGGREEFVRSPRSASPVEPRVFKVEQPPAPATKRRIPLITSLAPLVMAGVTYALTRNVLSLLFALLSPVIGFASFIESRMHGKAQFRASSGAWQKALVAAAAALEDAQEEEMRRSRSLYPDVRDLAEMAAARDPILWSRTPRHDDLLRLRVGTGPVPSVHGLELPEAGAGSDLLAEAIEVRDQKMLLDGAPVTIDLDSIGVVGITGLDPGDVAYERRSLPQEQTARSLVLQAAMMVGPGHLNVVAFVPERELDRWDWLKWLPHARSGASLTIASEATSAQVLAGLNALVSERLESGAVRTDAPKPVPRVLVIASESADLSRPRFAPIISRGPAAGVATCWIGSKRNLLPDGCRAVIDHRPDGAGSVEFVEEGRKIDGVSLEGIGVDQATRIARSLAPLIDAAASSGGRDIPALVRVTELAADLSDLDDARVADARWARSTSLGAPVGIADSGPFEIDLRIDGPHGLVAGTTGAGKSELLQSFIATLAMRHPPGRLNFLLVDYKGGAAFREAADLPHTVGFVTDLDEHLVRRSLVALGAELTRREHLLNLAAAKDLASMEAAGHPETPPSLLIVVDEFAALAGEVPEFVDGVVDIAQRGRSLGLHLLLATQRPAGVVTDYIRANTNLRIALRVARDDESVDVIGTKDAAQISRSVPGRAIARIGPTELVTFQSAFAGARDNSSADLGEAVSVFAFESAGLRPLLAPAPPRASVEVATDLHRIVATLAEAHAVSGEPDPRRPWLPPLGSLYPIREGATPESASRLVLGVADHPEEQAQRPAIVDLTAGHLLVIGAGRSGKTVALRTVAAAAQLQQAETVWVYGLDSAGRGLSMVAGLPVVGSIVAGDDHERVARLFRTLRRLIDDRVERMGAAGAQDLIELRRRSGANEARVLVLLDGLHSFLADYETFEGGKWVDALSRLMADGLASGVHFVAAGDRRGGIPTRVLTQFQQQLCLRLANEDDYMTIGLPRGSLNADSPPGRGFLDGIEIQVAILGASPAGDAQTQAVETLARDAAERKVNTAPPPEIGVLPDRVLLTDLPAAAQGLPVIGMSDDDLGPATFDPSDGLFGIFGARATGRTTALLTIADAVRRANRGIPTLLVASRAPPPALYGSWTRVARDPADAVALVEELADRAGEATRFSVFVDDVTDHIGTAFEAALARLVPLTRAAPILIAVSGDAAAARSAYGSELLTAIKRMKSGLVLMPDLAVDGDTLGVTLPRGKVRFVPGRGYLIGGGALELVQVADTTAPPNDGGT